MLNATVMEPIADSTSPDAAAAVDSALARSAAGGDMQAFEALYRRHAGRVHGVIQRLVGFHGVRAEDLTQEAFVRAWQALPAFRFESAFGTWLHRLAANTALMELRSRRGTPAMDGDEDALDGVGVADSAGHGTALSMDLEQAVARLPPRARAVLVLHDVLGLDSGHRRPKFVKDFLAEGGSVAGAVQAYVAAVRDGSFPDEAHSYA